MVKFFFLSMKNQQKSVLYLYLFSLAVIAIDQLSKMLVHFNMEMGPFGEINVLGDWFRLHYLLNPGMAFGMQFDHEYGKLFLTLFRILASGGLAYAIYYLAVKRHAHKGLLVAMAAVLGGAVGNLVDSVFYGVMIPGNAIPGAPTPWFYGQVIDMLYFPMFSGTFPGWMPIWGGQTFLFFSPVFNIADSAIFLGMVFIMLFQERFAKHEQQQLEGHGPQLDTTTTQEAGSPEAQA